MTETFFLTDNEWKEIDAMVNAPNRATPLLDALMAEPTIFGSDNV